VPTTEIQRPGVPARVVGLLAAAVFINYVDRGNLATAAPLVQGELSLSNIEIGALLSAFYWTYAPLQLLAGWLAERLNVSYLLAAGLGIWSLATVGTGLASGFLLLLLCRLTLGVGESVFYPCSCKLLAMRARDHQRGKANGVISSGQALGPTVGTLVGGLLMAQFGWRAVMVAFGLLSLSWLWPWLVATRRDSTGAVQAGVGSPVTYRVILGQQALWGASVGQFCNNYTLYFVLSWLPLYLVNARGFSVSQMSALGALVYCVYAASCTFTGWGADRLVAGGHSPNRVHKFFIVSSSLGIGACMLLIAGATRGLAIPWLALAGVFFGFGTPMIFVIAQTLAGPRATGQWMGLQNFAGNLAGIIAPAITGFIVDRTGSFYLAFALAGAIALLGAVAWGLVIPRVEALRWPELAPEAT
jgi:MFS family permease